MTTPEHDEKALAHARRWPERLEEVKGLQGHQTLESLARLTELATDVVDDVAQEAMRVLLDRGPSGVTAFLRVWLAGDDFVGDNARGALVDAEEAGVEPIRSIRALERHADNDQVRSAAQDFLALNVFAPEAISDRSESRHDARSAGSPAANLAPDALTGALHEHLLRLSEEMPVPQEVIGRSGDQRISLTLVGGRATELTIDARAMRQTNADLAEEVLEAINAALTAQSDGDGERAMGRLAGLGEVLERSRRQAEEQLVQVEQGLRDTAAARTETDARYRHRDDR